MAVMKPLEGKVAIVTGAARLRGIGRATAVSLAELGADVPVTTTSAPNSASDTAVALPMPRNRAAPVTIATLPSNGFMTAIIPAHESSPKTSTLPWIMVYLEKNGMEFDRRTCSQARKTRDPRFDGHIFIGVLTSGVYCRPICPAPSAKERNCRYYP